MSKVAENECTRDLLPAGARHTSVARDGDLTCRVGIAAVESAEAKAEAEAEAKAEAKAEAEAEAEAKAEAEAEAELDGGPSKKNVDDIRRLEPVWMGGTLDPQ
jgi:hypothetical protein